ncbi:hypothetical protein A4V04_05035 [Burkholderiales bacterium YL45]|nr:hypothetical protein A4V04_05035 [Burkholderiales bacterium YL45]
MLFRSLFGFYLKFFQKITKQVSKNTQNKGDPLSLIRFLDSSKDKKLMYFSIRKIKICIEIKLSF